MAGFLAAFTLAGCAASSSVEPPVPVDVETRSLSPSMTASCPTPDLDQLYKELESLDEAIENVGKIIDEYLSIRSEWANQLANTVDTTMREMLERSIRNLDAQLVLTNSHRASLKAARQGVSDLIGSLLTGGGGALCFVLGAAADFFMDPAVCQAAEIPPRYTLDGLRADQERISKRIHELMEERRKAFGSPPRAAFSDQQAALDKLNAEINELMKVFMANAKIIESLLLADWRCRATHDSGLPTPPMD